LNQIIDYAGLFPPANLPLDVALQNYLRDKATSPHRWMLGRFVCPAAKLTELSALISRSTANGLQVTALGQQAAQADDVVARIDADLQAIAAFRRDLRRHDVIDVYEVAVPKGVPLEAIPHWSTLLQKLHDANLRGFIEVFDDAQLKALTQHKDLGAKLRCGGVTANAFPSDERVASFVARCRDAGIAWKATAGLHHPRRHWDAKLQVWHHGFLNVFIGGLIALVHRLATDDITQILTDRDGRHFHFNDDALGWKGWSCTTEQITQLRGRFATTFGSCSFQEPTDDLLALGLIETTASRAP
jgi:hypothetical protein